MWTAWTGREIPADEITQRVTSKRRPGVHRSSFINAAPPHPEALPSILEQLTQEGLYLCTHLPADPHRQLFHRPHPGGVPVLKNQINTYFVPLTSTNPETVIHYFSCISLKRISLNLFKKRRCLC